MKSFPINKMNITKLNNESVIFYYDRPILYSCELNDKAAYLVMLAYEENDLCIWLYVQVSNERMAKLQKNQMTLYDAFKASEDRVVYVINEIGDRVTSIEVKKSIDILNDLLPDDDLYIGDYFHINGKL